MTSDSYFPPGETPPAPPPAEPVPAFVPEPEIHRAITPLRMVFWGGLIVVFDFSINGFDLINDVIGMILIAIGVFQLASFDVGPRYRGFMTFARIMAIVGVIGSLLSQVGGLRGELGILLMLVGLAELVATILFCVAMRLLSERYGLAQAAQSWRTTTLLFVLIYLIPLGGFYLIALGAILAGESFHINLGPAGLLLLPIFFVPLVHLFVSTSRMKRAAQAA